MASIRIPWVGSGRLVWLMFCVEECRTRPVFGYHGCFFAFRSCPFAGSVICWIWSHQIDLKGLCGGHFMCVAASVRGFFVSFTRTSLSYGPLACVLRCYGSCLPGC
eukprot:475218-Pelagomonas_calceolata.AAC.1